MNTRDPLAGTRPAFLPDALEPVDPLRREQDLRAIFDSPPQIHVRSRRPYVRLAAVAAGVATAVVVAVIPGADAPSAQATPRDVLVAAAEAVANTDVPATGKYWHERSRTEGLVPMPAGEGHDAYLMVRSVDSETWDSRTGAEVSIGVSNTDVTGHPLTPEDEAEWRKAGAPPMLSYPMADQSFGVQTYTYAEKSHTISEMLALPTDADALKAYLLDAPPPASEDLDEWLTVQAQGLLTAPATRETRAAAYRLLAELPGFRVMEEHELPPGSVGLARTARGDWDYTNDDAVLERQLVIDPHTGSLRVQRIVLVEPGVEERKLPAGSVLSTVTITASGWTDAEPVIPPGVRPFTRPHQ